MVRFQVSGFIISGEATSLEGYYKGSPDFFHFGTIIGLPGTQYNVLWSWHPTPKDITDDGNGIVASSLGGKSEVRAVLVQDIDE